jgi:pilus assembly protein CpaB
MGRMRGLLWLVAGTIMALLAGVVAYVTLSRATTQNATQGLIKPKVSVVVAARAVTVRALLATEDLQLREMPVEAVPEGALKKVEDAQGKIVMTDLFPGEVILSQRLVDPNVVATDGRLAMMVGQDEILLALPAQDLMSRINLLKPGDHVDLLFSLDFPTNRAAQNLPQGGTGSRGSTSSSSVDSNNKEQATFNLLPNVTIAAIVQPGKASDSGGAVSAATNGAQGGAVSAPTALLLKLKPQDALILKYVKDAGGALDIVLRAPGDEKPDGTEPVDVDYVMNRYRILGGGQ